MERERQEGLTYSLLKVLILEDGGEAWNCVAFCLVVFFLSFMELLQ